MMMFGVMPMRVTGAKSRNWSYGIFANSDTAIALEAMLHWTQRVPVGRRLRDERGAEHAGGAHAVVDDDLLAPQAGETIGEQARDDVGRGARAERDDVADGLGRKTCELSKWSAPTTRPGTSRAQPLLRRSRPDVLRSHSASRFLLRNGAAVTNPCASLRGAR